MNYIVVFRRGGNLMSLFFAHRDESDVAYKRSTLIRNEDDVIRAILLYFAPDKNITEQLRKLLDEESNIP